jgi:5-methylcytosine-specific restriction endonuclease McrA
MTFMPKPLSQTASARWKRRNKAHVKSRLKEWIRLNSDRRKAYRIRYNQERKEIQKAYDAERYLRPNNVAKRLARREEKKQYMRQWALLHPHYGSVSHSKRKARKRANGIGNQELIRNWIKGWKSKHLVRCFWCLCSTPTKDCHSDHITPLKKGGAHSIENLCISCGDCNRKKHDKLPQKWNEFLLQPILL